MPRTPLFWILLLALVLRLALVAVVAAHPERALTFDSGSYTDFAQHMFDHGGQWAANVQRTPVYPTLLAILYALFGKGCVTPVLIVQAFISVGSVWLTARLVRDLRLGESAALVAAALMAVSVESVTPSCYLMTETLFTAIQLIGLIVLVRVVRTGSLGWLAVCGLLHGIAILTRPAALLMPAIIALIIIGPMLLRREWRQAVIHGAVLVVSTMALLVPWIMHTERELGFASISPISNYNTLYYSATMVTAHLEHRSETDIRNEWEPKENALLAARGLPRTQGHVATVRSELGSAILREHPLLYAWLHLKADANSLLPDITTLPEMLGFTVGNRGTLSVLNQHGLLAAIRYYFGGNSWLLWVSLPIMLLLGAIYACGLVGGIALVRERQWLPLAVLVLVTAYYLLLPGAPSMHRFRVPVMPMLCALAGLGWPLLRQRFAALRRR
jgi:hypothetical protein